MLYRILGVLQRFLLFGLYMIFFDFRDLRFNSSSSMMCGGGVSLVLLVHILCTLRFICVVLFLFLRCTMLSCRLLSREMLSWFRKWFDCFSFFIMRCFVCFLMALLKLLMCFLT